MYKTENRTGLTVFRVAISVCIFRKKTTRRHRRSLKAYAPRFRTDERGGTVDVRVPGASDGGRGGFAQIAIGVRRSHGICTTVVPIIGIIGIIARRLGGAERPSCAHYKKKTGYNYTGKKQYNRRNVVKTTRKRSESATTRAFRIDAEGYGVKNVHVYTRARRFIVGGGRRP